METKISRWWSQRILKLSMQKIWSTKISQLRNAKMSTSFLKYLLNMVEQWMINLIKHRLKIVWWHLILKQVLRQLKKQLMKRNKKSNNLNNRLKKLKLLENNNPQKWNKSKLEILFLLQERIKKLHRWNKSKTLKLFRPQERKILQ